MNEILELLNGMTTNELSALLKLIGIKGTYRVKEDKINSLYRFYADNDCIKNLWNGLSAFEKDYLTCVVQSEYSPHSDDLKVIFQKHSIKTNSYYSSYSYDKKTSKLGAILIGRRTPAFIRRELNKIIPKYEAKIEAMKDFVDTDDYEGRIVDRSDRYSDFDMLIKFVNIQNVTATKAEGLISKSSLIKYHKIAGYEDIFRNDIFEMSEIRKASDTTVSYGMVQLLIAAAVLKIDAGKFKLGENANYFVGLNVAAKAKFLYEIYMKSTFIIEECQRIMANKLAFSKSNYDLTGSRSVVINMLKICPPREWVAADEFKTQLRKKDNSFLRNVVNDVSIRDDYYMQYYNSPGWDEFEYYFIDVVLMEYLAVIGAVDVCTNNECDDYDTRTYPVVKCFRVTELGMFLFGMADEYKPKRESSSSETKGFVIQPNFDIIVFNGSQRMAHEIYFDRFLEKITDDSEVSIYKLEFAGIVKALDIGIKIPEICDYLRSCSSVPVPENVMNTLGEWEAQSIRIRVRTVTIVEADDEFLLEEIKNYRGMKEHMLGGIKNALEIQPQKSLKVKRLIEKNKRFCILE